MKKLTALMGGILAAGLSLGAAPAAQAAAHAAAPAAAGCAGTYTIGVGGTGDNTSAIYTGHITQRVGYNASTPTGYNARLGVNELNRLVRDQRGRCPGQHVKILGYSLGAAVVHTWVTENWKTFSNVNAVLIADPKRKAGPGNAGAAAHPAIAPVIGAPLSGADDYFGNVPVVTICTDDVICDLNANSGIPGYLWQGAHGHYSFNVDSYSDDGHGQWFNGKYIP